MARIEAEHGAALTYNFRTIDKTFEPTLFESVEDLGHEVGYHYEDVDTADGDLDAAAASFATNLQQFREHVDVDTVSMHGNPLTAHDNRDLWDAVDFDDYDLLGEVYLSVDFSDVVYFSDTNRTWYDEKTIAKDWPVGPSEKPVQVRTTPELRRLVEQGTLPRLYLLVHSDRWTESYPRWGAQYLKDTAINAAKMGLWAVRTARRRRQPTPIDA